MVVYLKKNSKEFLELKDEFIKVAKYKINTQKSIEFPYSRNKQKIQIKLSRID